MLLYFTSLAKYKQIFDTGYAPCRVLTGPDFQSVFNLQLWASNAKLINYYMLYGYVQS
jgi:hypothetical protein